MFKGSVQVAQGLGKTVVIDEWLAQLDRFRQPLAGHALLAQQALAAEHHVTVEEGIGQGVVRVMGRTGALMDVLREKIQLEVAAELGARPGVADPVQDDLLGGVQRRHHPAVLPGQFQAACFYVQLADGLEQRRLDLQVQPQFPEQPGQALLHRLIGEQGLPQHRQYPVPGRTGHQQQGFMPEVGDFAAALVHADHGVYGQDQCGRGNCPVAFAQCPEHGQAETGQGQRADHQPGVGEKQFDTQGRGGETHQGHQQGVEAALPAVIGFRQRAGDNPQKQRDQQRHLILIPAESHAAGQGDKYPYAVTELVQCPQATQGMLKAFR